MRREPVRKNSALQRSVRNRALVQVIRRQLEEDGEHLVGVPVAVGTEWLVISRLGDAILLDGFDALRLSDITDVKHDFQRRSFYVRGLKHKRAALAALPALDLNSGRDLLRSAQRCYSLLVISREIENPGVAEIGRIIRASSHSYAMRLLTPNAKWVSEGVSYRTGEITRIGFGGEYEETLAAVAGLADPKWT